MNQSVFRLFLNSKLFALLPLFLIVLAHPAYAHFHYQIEVTTAFQLDDKKQLNELKFSWLYGEKVSHIMLEDVTNVAAFSKDLMRDLAKLGYFTQLQLNGQNLKTTEVTDYKLEKINQSGHTRLKLNFILPLKSAIVLKGNNTLAIDHTDPTSSAIVFYKDNGHILFDKSLKPYCKAMIQEKKNPGHGESPQIIHISCKMPQSTL